MAPPKRKKWTHRKQHKLTADKVLSEIYYNFGKEGALNNTPDYLHRLGRSRLPHLTRKRVMEFLIKQPSYTVHRRQARLQFPRRKINIRAPGIRADADLVDMQDLAKWNDSYKYILVVIDAFTKFTWIRAMKNKMASTTAAAFKHLMDKEALSCLLLYSDSGTEFLGQPFQSLLRERDITHRICGGDEFHCPFVERVNRTLKEKLYQAMTASVSRRWIDLLPKIVATYNQTIHSATKKRPMDVTDANSLEVYQNIHRKEFAKKKKKKPRFVKGDYVRIAKLRTGFDRGYLPRFTWEVFRIAGVVRDNGPIPAYFLEDMNGERIKSGIFYESELSRVDPSLVALGSAWPVREILDRRKGGRELLVWWQGFPRQQAEWISADQLVKV